MRRGGKRYTSKEQNLLMTAPAAKLPKLFTLGHSNLEMSDLLGTLLRHEIKVLCDIRSRPGSFRYPQFNRQPLEARLTAAKIRYEFYGEQLGGGPWIHVITCQTAWWIMPAGAKLPIFWRPWTAPSRVPAKRIRQSSAPKKIRCTATVFYSFAQR